jgi:single-strand DNA-binding protein
MASSLNKVILIGRVGKDPEIRFFQDGTKVANFSVATSESWKDKTTGERKEKTEWHRINIINENLASIVEQYVKKGNLLYIEGQLQTRKWNDQNGQERYSTEIVLSRFRGELVLLESRNGSMGHDSAHMMDDASHLSSLPKSSASAPHTFDDLNDDIPF